MDAVAEEASDSPDTGASPRARTRVDPALAVFLAVEAVAGIFYLVIGRHVWFYLDDWDFIVDRRATSLHDLFASHNGHWVTLPILAYRALYWAVGLRSYLPYQLLIVAAHLVAALLLRVVMRRAGVRPWTATVVAGALVLFGAGFQNIIQAFQITMVWSLIFGLVHLVLADHDGPPDRRDLLGIGAGLLALMCSGVGVPLVTAVGLAALMRRGWRAAALHTVPLGGVYLLWWLVIGHRDSVVAFRGSSFRHFVVTTITTTFDDLGQIRGVGVALGAILVVGFAFAWFGRLRAGDPEARRAIAAPTGLLVASLVFLAISAIGRASVTSIVQGRYEHILAAMLLPALAVAIDTLGRRWKVLVPLLALVLVGVPGNLVAAHDAATGPVLSGTLPKYRRMIATLPHVRFAPSVPPDLRPEPVAGRLITIGWLLQAEAAGKLPAPGGGEGNELAVDELRLSVAQHSGSVSGDHVCHTVDHVVVVGLATGDEIDIRAGIRRVRLEPAGGRVSGTLPFNLAAPNGSVVRALRPVTFRVVVLPHASATVCATPHELVPDARPGR